MLQSTRSLNRQTAALIVVLIVLIGVAVYFAAPLPSADWIVFDTAARGVFKGLSPYEHTIFMNPPWAVALLLPFALFPPDMAHGLFFVASALALIFLAWRLRASPLTMTALMLSPTAVGALLVGNLDALAYLGMVMPPMWGLFMLLIKPQIGLGAAFYYIIQSYRKGGIAGSAKIFLPITLALVLSAVLFPEFIQRIINQPENIWNRSMFPYAIPLGLFFMGLAFQGQNPFFALAAMPFLTPYLTFYSYLAVQMALLHEDVEKVIRRDVLHIVLSIILWVLMLTFRL